MEKINKWDKRFLELAKHISGWSKDPSNQVGAVIVNLEKKIVAVGYNGFPKGVADDDRLSYRDKKYDIILHAEENALITANNSSHLITS